MYTVIGIVKWTSCKLNYNHSCIKLFQTKIILNSLLVKFVSASVKRVSAWTWPNSAARMAGLRPFKSTMFGLAPRSRRNEIIFSLFLHAAKWRPVSPFSGSRLTSKIQILIKAQFMFPGICILSCKPALCLEIARVIGTLACENMFLLALRRWGRFARRNICDSVAEIPYWWRKSMLT